MRGLAERLERLERHFIAEAAQPAPVTRPGEVAVPIERNMSGKPVRWIVIGATEAML